MPWLRVLFRFWLWSCLVLGAIAQDEEPAAPEASPSPPAPSAPSRPADRDLDFQGPSGGSVRLGSGDGWGLGTAVGDPSALFGPDRTETVLSGTIRSSTINLTGNYLWRVAPNQRFLVELNLDPTFLGTDLSYSWQPEGWEGFWTSNLFLSSARFAPFDQADPQVILPNGYQNPFLQQAGWGLEYAQEMTSELDLAVGFNYQNYAYADSLLGGVRFPRDGTGTPLALLPFAQGDLFTFNVHGAYDALDDRNLPTRGTKIRFGLEQGLGLGATSASYTRLAANLSHLVRAPGWNDGPHALVFNVQAGTILGDGAPQLRGFHLGGPTSVRGFQPGEMASGTSFLQGSMEYRHHLTTWRVMEQEIDLRATAFLDYATTLGTVTRLRGMPESLWDKPTDATGYGVGLQFGTGFGLFRLESAWNSRGGQATTISIGERF